MDRRLRSDLLRTALLASSLVFFPLFVHSSPPPEGLKMLSSWQVTPLNIELSERYYSLAIEALSAKQVNLNKAYVTAAIHFDPEAFSVRYSEYKRDRDQVLQ